MMCESSSHCEKGRIKRPSLRWLLKSAALYMAMTCCMDVAQGASPLLKLRVGGHHIRAEVAATLKARDIGLMNRRSLLLDHGMLFVFPEAHRHCMWMRNTQIPLSVAFLDDRGTIVNIEDMQPNTTDYHCAARPVRYALEMERGWFKRRGLVAGVHIDGLENAPFGR
jgi:uncharacterized membrane protein (UPF0127 family)